MNQDLLTLGGNPPMPEYDNHKLTRNGILTVLAQGGTVLWNGHLIERTDQVPSEAILARGNVAREEAARASLLAQIAKAQAELSAIGTSPEMVEPTSGTAAGQAAGTGATALQPTPIDPNEPNPLPGGGAPPPPAMDADAAPADKPSKK